MTSAAVPTPHLRMDLLPEFPTQTKQCKFPYFEGEQWEFKASFPLGIKLSKIVCAFLNNRGGYLVVGVTDDRRVVGPSPGMSIDHMFLLVDDIYHQKHILCDNDEPLAVGAVTAEIRKLSGKDLVVVRVVPEHNKVYKIRGGVQTYRLSASNYILSSEKFYTEGDVKNMMTQYQAKAAQESERALRRKVRDMAEEFKYIRMKMFDAIDGAKAKEEKLLKMLHDAILADKARTEATLAERARAQESWWSPIAGLFLGCLDRTSEYEKVDSS
jgi:predicted HTH transcriptional regulator